jgi:hypothetical protein
MKTTMVSITLAVLFLAGPQLGAQDDPAFRAWLKNEQKKFQEFKDANDSVFYAFLKKEWRGVELAKGMVKDPIPDLPQAPVYQPSVVKQTTPAPAAPQVVLPPPPKTESVAARPSAQPSAGGVEVKYFGTTLSLPITAAMRLGVGDKPSEESIAEFFASMSHIPCDNLILEAKKFAEARHLNDWGYCLLLHTAGERIYGPSSDGATLFTWCLLMKSGFDARVGFTPSRVILLLPAEERLYGVLYCSIGGDQRRYYAVPVTAGTTADASQLYSYEGSHHSATRLLRFAVERIPLFDNPIAAKTLSFTFSGVKHDVPLQYSRDAVLFFQNYPQTDFTVYFDGSISDGAASSLYNAFKPLLAGRDEVEAVNILLRFSQTAFGYKVDKELFGREKPMFPDEVLYYDYSNCKDRAILFAYLVRRLTGLEVVGLDYPGHISTAVRFRGNVRGDAVQVREERFVICDPTYINADAGMCMPQFQGVEPSIITLKKPS